MFFDATDGGTMQLERCPDSQEPLRCRLHNTEPKIEFATSMAMEETWACERELEIWESFSAS